MPGDAYGVFLLVASACMIILTIFAAVITAIVVRTGLEILRLVRLIRSETEGVVAARRRVLKGVRFARRFAGLFLKRAVHIHG